MIQENSLAGMVLTITPRRVFDEQRRSYTDEIEVSDTGQPRYRLVLAVPGSPDPVAITVDGDALKAAGIDPDHSVGILVTVQVRQRVEVRWSVADRIVRAGAAPVAEDFE